MINTNTYSFFSRARRYRFRSVLIIALFWTAADILTVFFSNIDHLGNPSDGLFVRILLVFIMSLLLSYLFVFTLKRMFRNFALWINFALKAVVLLLIAFAMNFIVHFIENKFVHGLTVGQSLDMFFEHAITFEWMTQKIFYWVVLFIITQLYIEINEKYSPGVFADIILGKYKIPKVENRIVMFLDLKDSTPIAEKLGHQQYFLFIREFIYDVSMALIEHEGRIYQYVGDEIVVSWINNNRNIKSTLKAVIEARKNIQAKSNFYRKNFDQVPEFRVGIHIGDVTVGEIGIIKKDLAMSGDTMNTTARIRSACNELKKHFIVSAAFTQQSDLKSFQVESLGEVELKGKSSVIELFSLKI